jgi:putative membrane protein
MMITTATSHVVPDFSSNRLMQVLAVLCGAVWMWAAIAPISRMDWLLENVLLFVGVGLIVAIYRRHPLSQLSYVFIAIFFSLHTMGAHYTYSEVPWGVWLQEITGAERNHYDRIVHFTFGLLIAYPVRELLMRVAGLRGFASYFFAFATLVAASEIYELIEWLVASAVSPEAAMAFLGTQGDPFDAQKDTGLALVGTVLTLVLTKLLEKKS